MLPGPSAPTQDRASPVSHQLSPTADMVAVNLHPSHTVSHDGKWSTGLYDWRWGGLCFACWCPASSFGRGQQRLEALEHDGRPLTNQEIEHFSPSCLTFAAVEYSLKLGWLLDMREREKVRKRYGIHGSALNDTLVSMFCGPCASEQSGREVEREENAVWAAQGVGPGGKGVVIDGSGEKR